MADKADFLVDGAKVRTCLRPPGYPMQLMLAVFDFPEKSDGTDTDHIPALIVDYVREYPALTLPRPVMDALIGRHS